MNATLEAPVIDATNFDVTRHDGFVTLNNTRTGQHRKFAVKTKKSGAFAGKRLVYLVLGADAEDRSGWMPFGDVDEFGIRVWKKNLGTDMEKFAKLLERPSRYAAVGLEYLVDARCRRCGRTLTNPDSIKTGLGPICAGRGT
jgi:hypothetical protein